MSRRAIHLYPWDGGTEADTDMPDHVYCGTDGNMADDQLTNEWEHVTCKRCLKIHEREKAFRAAEDRDQKVKLFDEAEAITVGLGHLNISTAIKALIAENKRLAIREDVLENLCDARFRINLDLETERDKLKAEVERIAALNHAQFGDAIRSNAERDQLKAEVEALRKDRTDWQSECLKRGFEYVRESDDHYVLADVPEMADLLGDLLGVEVRSKENDAYEEASSQLNEQIEGLINTIHAQEELRKDAERYRFVRNPVGNGSAFAIWSEKTNLFLGKHADEAIDAAMGKGEKV